MQESKNGGTIFPRAKLYLNSSSGTLFCIGTGTTAITNAATRYTFSCSTTTAINVASADRFYLWVGVNMTKAPTGGGSLTANLQFNGSAAGVTDSTISAPVPPPPNITSLSVTSGNAETPVTISGAHFGSTTGTVTFNGVSATVSTWTDGSIGTSVPALASTGNVVVANSNGPSNGVPFSVPPPAITSLSTSSGAAGNPVTITGSHFGASQGSGTVTFNGTIATVSSWSDGSISTSVPVSATTGNVIVTAANGETSTGVSFTVPAPIITNISPDFARVGTSVAISGNNFGSVQGSLSFNGTAAVPSSWTNNQIVTPVPNGATTGPVVVTQAGTSNSVNFTVDPPPSITSISPTSGPVNTSVAVTGSGFGIPQGTSTIQFNGAAAIPFSWGDSSIVVQVPTGATTGPVAVSSGGFNSNGITFTVTPGPSISSLSVPSGAAGTSVTINGQNFGSTQGNSAVRFNSIAASPTTWSASSIGVTVPFGATTGQVTVTVSNQTSNGVIFTVITTGTLSGTISSAVGGSAISGATVQALQNGTVKASASSAGDGTYSIPNLVSGNYDIQASASGFGTALINSVAVTAGQTATANFSLSFPGTISGKVTQADGVSAIPGATVQLFVGSASANTTLTDNSGNYSIGGLNAGSYALEASATNFVTQTQTAAVTGANTSTANFLLQSLGSNPINYVYDELGRLVSVIDSSGDTATYKYDAVGNILSISRQNSSKLSIISFTPQSGTSGTSVTINGTGFSTTPSQNTVTFNGVSATVGSATTTQLTTTVPATATTGPITVTTPSDSVTSNTSFTVLTSASAPTISSFTPNMGTSGTAIAITGTNFDIAANDKVTFNTSYAAVSSTTSLQLNTTVPSFTGSGHISVATPAGTATSTQDFYVPFDPHVVGDIGYTGRILFGGTQTVSLASGKIGLLLFDGSAGQGASLQLSGSTFSSCTLYLYSPTQVQLASSDCSSSTAFLISTALASTGTYTIGINPGASAGSIGISLTQDVTGTITAGTPLSLTTTIPGQGAHYTFSGTAGQQASVTTTSSTYSSICGVALSILNPNGTILGSNSQCGSSGFLGSVILPVSGTYTIVFAPQAGLTGSATLLLSIFNDITGPITPGTAINVGIRFPGQNARYTFSGTAGQQTSVSITSSTYPSCTVGVSILKPDGTTLGSLSYCGGSGLLDSLTLPVSGTYTVFFDPQGSSTGSATALLSIFNDLTGTITPGTPLNVTTTAPGQNARYTFSGTAGQQASVSTTNSTYSTCTAATVNILKPDGTTLGSSGYCGSSALLGSLTLPVSGTYTVLFDPQGAGTGSATLLLSIFNDITGSITPGTPITFTTSFPGQDARYNFSGTAGQVVSAEVTGFTGGSFTVSLLNPDGSTLASSCCNNNQGSITGKTLATTGTYQIVIAPSVTGSATVSLITQTTNGTISFGTPVVNTISVSSLIGLSFSGTAGQVVSTEAAGLNGNFALVLLNADGSQLGSSLGSGTLNITGKTLATTGTYQIVIIPNNGVTGSVTISLISQTTNAAVTFNTPVTNTISSSSLSGLSFSGTAGQVVSTEAAGLNGNFWLILLKPDGSQLGSAFGSGALNLTGKTLATTGTYQIVIIPNNGVTGSVTISLISQTTNAAVTFNTPVTNTISSSSLSGLSFSGTAGQVVSTEAAGLNGNFWLILLKPDGSQLGSAFGSGALNLTGKTLATTGTYQIVIIPNNGVAGSITVSLISQTTNGTISFGTPVTNAISVSSLIGLSFSGTAGQTVSVHVTPSFSAGGFWVWLLNPDGSALASIFSSTSVTFSGKTLASTGTYQIVIAPNNGVTGSATTSLTSP